MFLTQPTALEASAIVALAQSPAWREALPYFERAQREADIQLRAAPADQFQKRQGASLLLAELLMLPQTARSSLTNRT